MADKSKNREKIDIVGPVCETGDFFALDREMPEVREGDLLAIMSAGAYGLVMASNYNSRPLPAELQNFLPALRGTFRRRNVQC